MTYKPRRDQLALEILLKLMSILPYIHPEPRPFLGHFQIGGRMAKKVHYPRSRVGMADDGWPLDADEDEDEDATGCHWIIFCYEAAQRCAVRFGWLFWKWMKVWGNNWWKEFGKSERNVRLWNSKNHYETIINVVSLCGGSHFVFGFPIAGVLSNWH